MKKFTTLFLLFLFSIHTYSKDTSSISGVIESKGKIPSGTLFIFAKKFDNSTPMPLAVLKVQSPKFPFKFSLSKNNQMIKSMPFQGPFKVTARISPSGNAMDKSGIQASSIKKVELGDTDIKLVLKK